MLQQRQNQRSANASVAIFSGRGKPYGAVTSHFLAYGTISPKFGVHQFSKDYVDYKFVKITLIANSLKITLITSDSLLGV